MSGILVAALRDGWHQAEIAHQHKVDRARVHVRELQSKRQAQRDLDGWLSLIVQASDVVI